MEKWITDRTPEHYKDVLVKCETRSGKIYYCVGCYIEEGKTEVWNWTGEACEYSEKDDCYYVLPGWYERIHNFDECTHIGIDDNVVGWRQLPE